MTCAQKVRCAKDDQVVTLRSKQGEYHVVNDLPCLIPITSSKKNHACERCESLLSRCVEAFGYQSEPGLSTENEPVAASIRKAIRNSGAELFLDVGCGVNPRTTRLDACGEVVRWIGVEPVLGDLTRRDPFVR